MRAINETTKPLIEVASAWSLPSHQQSRLASKQYRLNAHGRIGKPTLKRKIRSRVKLIMDTVGARFPDLELVTDQAVDCRNFCVHGTPGKFGYGAHADQPTFFTDTLEFVFASSDLIEAGWDIAE